MSVGTVCTNPFLTKKLFVFFANNYILTLHSGLGAVSHLTNGPFATRQQQKRRARDMFIWLTVEAATRFLR